MSSRLIPGRRGPLSEVVAEARAHARNARMLAEIAWLLRQGPQLQAARGADVADKVYAIEQRLNALINRNGLITASTTTAINAASVPIAGLASVLSTGAFFVQGEVTGVVGGVATTAPSIRLTTPDTLAASFMRVTVLSVLEGNTACNNGDMNSLGVNPTQTFGAVGPAGVIHMPFWGYLVVSTGGTLNVSGAEGTNPWTSQVGSFLRVSA